VISLAEKIKGHEDIREATTINAIAHGSWFTKATLLISGFGNLIQGQIIKGFIFLGYQALTWFVFISFGWQYVRDFGTLGTQEMGRVFDETFEIYVNVPGDNSLQILLYSIFAFAILIAGQFIHLSAVRSSYNTEMDKLKGAGVSSLITDIKQMFDKNMHKTMLIPPSLGVLAFTVIPIIFMIMLAFTNFDRAHQPPGNLFTWVGLENFRNVFDTGGFMGSTFIHVLGWTLIWAVFATFLNYFFGMIVAIMINKQGIRLKSLWRTCFVIAIAVPAFVTLLFMRQILHDMGPVNVILNSLGMDSVRFLTTPMTARITVIIVNLWIGIP